MKTHKHISALLVVAITLLSSCSLLVSSPLPSSKPHPHENHHRNSKGYNELFEVSVEGGIFEFNCADDQFYISRVVDSSMPPPHKHSNSKCRCGQTTREYKIVNVLTYSGSFYTITCNRDEHNWVIKIDPLTATYGEFNEREVWVYMRDESDNSSLVFKFEQGDFEGYESIE